MGLGCPRVALGPPRVGGCAVSSCYSHSCAKEPAA